MLHEENISDGKLYNFQTRTWAEIVVLDTPYDLGSDMHYGAKVRRHGALNVTGNGTFRLFLKSRIFDRRSI